MSKKLIFILVALAVVVLAGGYFAYQQIQISQKQQAYQVSSDKIADEFVAAVVAHDIKKSMTNFSQSLTANYSEAYWKTTIFEELKDYKGSPKLHAKGAVQPASASVPNRYDPRLNQQATQYEYDFSVNNTTYRLTFVVFRENNEWKINEVSGGYLQ